MSPKAEVRVPRLVGVLLVAVLGVMSTEVLSVWEDVLPGGSPPWKVAVAAVALGGAGWAVREYAAGGRSRRARVGGWRGWRSSSRCSGR